MKAYHHSEIKTSRAFLETLKAGPYAWPGFYPLYFITSDGCALSFQAAQDNVGIIARSIRNKSRDGWRVVACDVNWENASLYCDHTGELIESAYAEDEVAE